MYNREIDEKRINESKERTIHIVMDKIDENSHGHMSLFSAVSTKFVLSTVSLVLVVAFSLMVLLNSPDNPIVTEPVVLDIIELSDVDQQKIVETSYVSSNIIAHALDTTIDISYQPLAFELLKSKFLDEAVDFDYYFQVLKPFMDNEDFSSYEMTVLENDDFDYQYTYTINQRDYQFKLSVNEGDLVGEMSFGDIVLDVTGEIKELNNQLKIKLEALSDTDYIEIEYVSKTNTQEIKKTYAIEEFINGELVEREISVNDDNGDITVDMKEDKDTYSLSKIAGEVPTYLLEYKISNVKGEAIIEEIEENGVITYQYTIDEDGEETTFDSEEKTNNGNDKDKDKDKDEEVTETLSTEI